MRITEIKKQKYYHKFLLKKFLLFLKKNRCLENYLYNCENWKITFDANPYDFISRCVKSCPSYLIYRAFDWDKTKESGGYWYAMDLKWGDVLNEINKYEKK